MAVAAPTRMSRQRLASPAIRSLLRRRLAELGGLALALAGLTWLVALGSYHALDPSFDTATWRPPLNMTGRVGAAIADAQLQFFGVAGGLPALALLGWAWRVASHRGVARPMLRGLAVLLAMPLLAAVLAATVSAARLAWPTSAGLGGAGGQLVATATGDLARSVIGPFGPLVAWAVLLMAGGGLTFVGLGLAAKDWRLAARSGANTMRAPITGGRRVAGFLSRVLRRGVSVIEGEPADDLAIYAPHTPVPPRTGRFDDDEDPPDPPPLLRPASVRTPAKVQPSARKPPAPRQESLALADGGWAFPTLNLLSVAPPRADTGPSEEALQGNARLLETVLGDYGVQGVIRDIRPGPVVTLYELEPAPGIRSARVIGLADDVARSLSVTAVRIATVPGRNVIGIEVPNAKRETVYLTEILGTEEWRKHPGRLVLALGKDIGGGPVVADLARMPHLLIAGTTGSGKSVGVNAMILSLLFRLSPEQCRLILIDPKMLELSVYDGIPHLMAPVVTEPAKAVSALKWTVREMERRYRAMSQLGVRNIGGYNDRVAEARARGEVVTRRVQTGFDSETGRPIFEEQPLALEPMPFLVVVIDEMADLMMVAGKEIEQAVQRLAQMARAAGIHVIMATQRPSVDVITGTIKANFPTRISFQVISKFDSRTILGEQGAEQLLGMGDLLHMVGGGRIARVHGPFVSDREVEDIVAFLRAQGEPAYVDDVTEPVDDDSGPVVGAGGGGEGEQGLFDQAVALVAREGKASTSFIQRHLSIGYNRAAKLIEQMEKEGIVSGANHVGKREVLVRRTADRDDD